MPFFIGRDSGKCGWRGSVGTKITGQANKPPPMGSIRAAIPWRSSLRIRKRSECPGRNLVPRTTRNAPEKTVLLLVARSLAGRTLLGTLLLGLVFALGVGA